MSNNGFVAYARCIWLVVVNIAFEMSYCIRNLDCRSLAMNDSCKAAICNKAAVELDIRIYRYCGVC